MSLGGVSLEALTQLIVRPSGHFSILRAFAPFEAVDTAAVCDTYVCARGALLGLVPAQDGLIGARERDYWVAAAKQFVDIMTGIAGLRKECLVAIDMGGNLVPAQGAPARATSNSPAQPSAA